MAIRQNIIQVPPVVGPTLALGCGEEFRAASKRAFDTHNDAEIAASKARVIRDKEFATNLFNERLKCNAIINSNPIPCVDRDLNIVRCGSGAGLPATTKDLENMAANCNDDLSKKADAYNIESAGIYNADIAAADDQLVKDIAAAGKAIDACCKATPKSEGCNSNGYGNIPARSV